MTAAGSAAGIRNVGQGFEERKGCHPANLQRGRK
jgi:hypothetical protein